MSEENTQQEDVPTPRNTTSTVEDLITLPILDETALLQNIKIRFQADLIYTWVGSILVSMNPYQLLPIYLPAVAQKYITRSASLPPHIFAVSDKTYKDMRREEKNQSVLISGESGAGKTEATKLILQYLAALTSKRSRVEQMILEASPILEAFGNAKTVRNNNSSRFGRFSEIQFGNESSGIVGARIVDYLLEKSRVVYQTATERNYHVFYQLCAGTTDEEKAELKLKSPDDYRYLNQSGCVNVEGVDDFDDFEQLKNALTSLNILPDVQNVMFKILSAILSLGDVNFVAKGDGCDVSNVETVTIVADLLKVDVEKLKHALTVRQMNVRGQAIVVPLKPPEANDSRDALAKALYGKLFSWLVKSINASLSAPPEKVRSFIGILDIFGFENFKVNSFEQFCINYANERLQQHFNQHIFKIEEEEYKKEKIDWASISFVDNQDCLDLIEKRPIGILSILDEECKFPKSTDLTFLEKLHKNLEKTARYEKPRLSKVDFGVEHFAGKVIYNSAGFLDKNKDTLQDDLKNVCLSSSESLVRTLFTEDDAELAAAPAAGATMKRGPLTVGAQFKTQLQQLMTTLSATTPHYVRCIKPNMQKKPKVFEDELVGAQLKYAGMLETIRIRKLGYPQRVLINDFYDRYKVLVPELMRRDPKDRDMDTLLANIPFEKGMWLKGITKIFLKDNEAQRLAVLRDQSLHRWAVIIQATWKMYYIRSYYVNMRSKAVTLQAAYRKNVAQNQYLHKKHAAIILESFARMVKPRLVFKRQVRVSKTAPSLIRGWLGRKHFAKALALDREKKRQIELRRMAMEEALERARMEEEERLRREEEERKELERQEMLKKLKAEADEKERLRLEEEERVRIASDKKYREKVEAERKEREKLEKERREKEAKELALLEEQRQKEEKEEQQRRDKEEALRKKKEEEDKKFKERMEELKVREQEREEREEEEELQRSSSKLAISFSSKRLALSPSQKSLSNSSLSSPRAAVSPRGGVAGGSINTAAILQQVRREQEVEQQKQQEAEPQTPAEPTSPVAAAKNTMEKGNRPTRAGKPRFRASTLGAIHPSYFTLRSTPKTDTDEELSIVSLASNVPRGTHFWNGREADLEGVSGNTTAREASPATFTAPSSLSQSNSAPLDKSPSSKDSAAIPTSPSTSNITTSPSSPPIASTSPAKKRWSGAFATLRARSTSQGSGSPEKLGTSPTAAANAPLASPRVTLNRASLSSPRTSLLSKDTAQASPRSSKLASITATLRGTPRSQAQETRMITIDAPLYPLLLTDKSVPVANLINKFESVAEKEKVEKELLDPEKKTEDIFEPKSPKGEEIYSWPSYVRNNFVPPVKGKKKGDEWRKLEHYRKKLKTPLLPCSDEQAVVALEIFPKVKDFVDGNQVEGQDEAAQLRWILDKALRNQQLRSEVYSQIIKQTFENPNPGALERALLLLLQLCSTCIPSSTETFRAVNSFLLTCKSPLALPARAALHELAPYGARENIPSIIELEQAKSGKQLQAVVQLSSGALRAVDINAFTTAKELVNSISELLGIPPRKFSPYGLYEGFHGLERLVKPETRIYDVISRWETYGVTMTERNIPTAFALHFKRYLVLDEEEQSAVERELDFHQAKSEIHKGLLPCREEDALKLASLLYFLDASLTPEQAVDRFIPKRLVFKHTTEEWYDLIQTDAKVIEAEFGKRPPRSAVIAIYCAAVRQLPLYGSSVFRVQHAGQWALPSELDIAVDRTGLQLLDPISKDSIKSLPFSHMLRWYGTANGLYIITTPRRSKEDNTTLLLQTSQATQVVIIMNMYFSVMLDKDNEFQAITEYTAQDSQYISFKRGEILTVNSKVADNTYQATNKEGATGLVPADHLQLVVEGELAPPIIDADAVSEDKATELFDAEGNKMKVARVVRVVGSDGAAPEEAPKEIKRQLWLENFALTHFRKHSSKPKKVSGGLFKSKKADYEQYDIPDRLLHSKDPLPDSLIDFGEDLDLNEEAMDLFSVVQKAMGDYPSNKHLDALTYEMIAKGCSKPALRDELFCQLAKQITNNTKPSSIIKGLELINLAAGCFVPSPNLFGCFEDFLAHLPTDVAVALRGLKKGKRSRKDKKKPETEAGEDEVPELVTKMAKDIHRRLETTWHAVGDRECAPSYLEMDAVKKMKQIAIKVQMSHGNFIVISIDSSTTIAEAFDKVIKKTQLIDPANYYLYFFVGNAERCLTNENEKVCDLITKAEHLQFDNTVSNLLIIEYYLSSLHHTPFGLAAIFGIRLRSRHLPHPLQPKDIAELDLVFYQVVETVMYGRYPCTYEDALLLGGLLVQAAYGDYNPSNPVINESTLPQFMRPEFIPSGDKLQLAEDLNAHHASHIGMPSTEAKSQYLKIYSKWKWAEASFFLVHQPRKSPASLLVVITFDNLHFMDPSNMEIVETHGFEVLSTWGCTGTTFNVKVGSLMKPINLIFNTTQGSEICLVLKSRVQADKTLRKYATPPASPSPFPPSSPFPTVASASSGSNASTSTSTSTSPSSSTSTSQPLKEIKKPTVPALQLNRAKMFNFE